MFCKIKFHRNSLPAVIAVVLYAVCLMVVGCSLEGSIESLRQKATGNCKHIWGQYIQTTAPDCTNTGVETRYCTLNNAHTEKRTVAALGHIWGSWQDSTATCTESGYETRYCKRDNSHTEKQPVAPLGHIWRTVSTTATCLYGGYKTEKCTRSNCNETRSIYEDALGHDWGPWEVITQATVTTSGSRKRTCYRCRLTESETIPRISP